MEQVLREFTEGLENKYTEFTLMGTDTGSYGRDKDTNLAQLLKEILKVDADYKINLRNVQPRFFINMMPDLIDVFRSGRIAFINSAFESGNDRILKLMNRGYNAKEYTDAMLTIKKESPKTKIRTQALVGFPSETEEEFLDTVRLVDKIGFDFVEIFMFQPRPKTKAAKMEQQIPERIVKRRYLRLHMKTLYN